MKTKNTRPLAERITQEPITASQLPGPRKVIMTAEQSALIDQIRHEAMETARETGRTPRQLADERAELIASLETLIRPFEKGWKVDDMPSRAEEARELLTRLRS